MVIDSLNVPQTVFSLFYAIILGLVANGQIRWKAFDWPLAVRGFSDAAYRPSWERLKLSLCYLTALPIIVFVTIVTILAPLPSPPRPEGTAFVFQLLVATIAAQAAFGPYRLWLGKIENDPTRFFYVASSGRESEYASQPWQREAFHYLDPQWSRKNWFAACGYIVIGILVSVVGRLLA